MSSLYPELQQAASDVIARSDQPEEFQRRLIRLIENAIRDNLADSDVREVIQLAEVDEMED